VVDAPALRLALQPVCRLVYELSSRFDALESGAVYGLAEWGLEDQRRWGRSRKLGIGDLCEEFLKARGEPAPAKEIVAYVHSRKRTLKTSILQCLRREERFRKLADDRYALNGRAL
jgi:hypothetical protein